MKNQKGITLIALVVTIVVLLILAGVAIAMLRGNNGILTEATKASDSTKKAEAEEAINNAINEGTTAYYDKKYVTKSFEAAEENFKDKPEKYVGYYLKNKATNLSKYATFGEYTKDSTKLVITVNADYGGAKYEYSVSDGTLTLTKTN